MDLTPARDPCASPCCEGLGWGPAGKELVSIAAQRSHLIILALPCGCLYLREILQLCFSPEKSKAQQCSEAGTPGVGKDIGVLWGRGLGMPPTARAWPEQGQTAIPESSRSCACATAHRESVLWWDHQPHIFTEHFEWFMNEVLGYVVCFNYGCMSIVFPPAET